MKVSDFFGKRIFSTAGREGYVIGMCADERSLFLICADSDEREFAVDMQQQYNIFVHKLFLKWELFNIYITL